MSVKRRAGQAAWSARIASFGGDLTTDITERIVAESDARLVAWAARGRIPMRVRIMARLARRPLRRYDEATR